MNVPSARPLLAGLLPVLACAGSSGGTAASDCSDILTGDLVITEVMANPAGDDLGNEYFEIYNATPATVDLDGLTLVYSLPDGSKEETDQVRALSIEAGEYLALGSADPDALPGFIGYGFGNDLGTLRNAGALLALRCADIEVDRVEYPSAEGTGGVSWGLDGSLVPDHIANDLPENFCTATTEFSPGLFGSPGEPNQSCHPVLGSTCSDGGSERDVIAPAVGDLVITEFMASPAGTDADQEWFEVYAAADVDLNGLVAGRDPEGEPELTIDRADCLHLAAGDYALFAHSSDAATNGGLPEVTQTFDFPLAPDRILFIGIGDEVLDEITTSGVVNGTASALDPTMLDPVANDDPANFAPCNVPYGPLDGGNRGSPGAGNEACMASSPGTCMEGGDPRPIISPASGEIRVSEVLANPQGTGQAIDPAHEWFELSVLGSFDLNGLEIGKAGVVHQTIESPECRPVQSGAFLVFAESSAPAENGGLPQVDFIKTFQLNNAAGSIFVGVGGTTLDTLTYGNAGEGVSAQVDPDGILCDTPATAPYGSGGDLGTPGVANPMCPAAAPTPTP